MKKKVFHTILICFILLNSLGLFLSIGIRTAFSQEKTSSSIERSSNIPRVKNSIDSFNVENDTFESSSSFSDIESSEVQRTSEYKKEFIDQQVHEVFGEYLLSSGWSAFQSVTDIMGTPGSGQYMSAVKFAKPDNSAGVFIEYQTHISNVGWGNKVTAGEVSGDVSGGNRLEAILLSIADPENSWYYRVSVIGIGWLGWTETGTPVGTEGLGRSIEAIEIKRIPKNLTFDKGHELAFIKGSSIKPKLRAHISNVGWQQSQSVGTVFGTTGRNLAIEALQFSKLEKPLGINGDIQMRAHVKNIGWQDWSNSGQVSGTTGKALHVEAIQIRLTNDLERFFDINYRVHVQNLGWLNWAMNGEAAGTAGFAYHVEAVEVRFVPKGGDLGKSTEPAFIDNHSIKLSYQSFSRGQGWDEQKSSPAISGTTGRNRALEAVKIGADFGELKELGGVKYKVYVSDLGWQELRSQNEVAGILNKGHQIEALSVNLTGEIAKYFNVYYRVHSANIGWLGWAANGEAAGTAEYGYQAEAFQIDLRVKGQSSPGRLGQSYRERFVLRPSNFQYTQLDPDDEKLRISINLKNNRKVKSVEFPTWTNTNNQDDLTWYRAKYDETQQLWYSDITLREQHYDGNILISHAYARLDDNSLYPLGAISRNISERAVSQFIAHRGNNHAAPENSLPAFRQAIHYGIETDIQLTADNRWVVLHDDTVDRMTNGSGFLDKLSFARLRSFRIDSGSRVTSYAKQDLLVPTLEEYLDVCQKNAKVPIIEIKTDKINESAYNDLVAIINRYGIRQRAKFISFYLEPLKQVKRRIPEASTMYLTYDIDDSTIATAKSIGDKSGLNIIWTSASAAKVQKAKANGLTVGVWTVPKAQHQNMRSMGVDYITTDE